MNLSTVVDFVTQLDLERFSYPKSKIVVCVEADRRALTNAVFLLGSYMILKLDLSTHQVLERFSWPNSTQLVPYRDATFSQPDFDLDLSDCWRGLEKGRDMGWIRYADSGDMWGQIDIEEYRHYDSPANGNLNEVVPGKFIAFQVLI